MSLTLTNAATVLDHCAAETASGGFTRTSHCAVHIDPGDLWCPGEDADPHTVTELHRNSDHITLIDQVGGTYIYPINAVLRTAVPDPLVPVRGRLVDV